MPFDLNGQRLPPLHPWQFVEAQTLRSRTCLWSPPQVMGINSSHQNMGNPQKWVYNPHFYLGWWSYPKITHDFTYYGSWVEYRPPSTNMMFNLIDSVPFKKVCGSPQSLGQNIPQNLGVKLRAKEVLLHICKCTPPKLNIDPTKWWLEDEPASCWVKQ